MKKFYQINYLIYTIQKKFKNKLDFVLMKIFKNAKQQIHFLENS